MNSVLIAPRKYVQGRGALKDSGKYLKLLGRKPLLLWDKCVRDHRRRDDAGEHPRRGARSG